MTGLKSRKGGKERSRISEAAAVQGRAWGAPDPKRDPAEAGPQRMGTATEVGQKAWTRPRARDCKPLAHTQQEGYEPTVTYATHATYTTYATDASHEPSAGNYQCLDLIQPLPVPGSHQPLPVPGSHSATTSAWISFSHYQCLDLIQPLPMPGSHSATTSAWISFSHYQCLDLIQPLPMPGSHSATTSAWISFSHYQCLDLIQPLPMPGSHSATTSAWISFSERVYTYLERLLQRSWC